MSYSNPWDDVELASETASSAEMTALARRAIESDGLDVGPIETWEKEGGSPT